MWNTSKDLLATIHDAHRRLMNGETDAIQAHAEARLLGAACKVLNIELEHAKATNRLHSGDDSLPGMTVSTAAGNGTPPPERPSATALPA